MSNTPTTKPLFTFTHSPTLAHHTGTYNLFRICLDESTSLRLPMGKTCNNNARKSYKKFKIDGSLGKTLDVEPLPWGLSTVAFEPSSYNVPAPEVCVKVHA